jgi:hypothetical protein
MSTPVEWDWPEEPRASRRTAPQVPELHLRVERNGAGYLRPRRTLGARLWSGYASLMMGLARLIVAVIVGAFTLAAFGLVVLLLRL